MTDAPPTLEQIALTVMRAMYNDTFQPHPEVLQKAIDALCALQAAAAQHAPTQRGDWAEAAAREFLDSCMIQPPWKNNVPVLAETIRRHAPQADFASVREAARRFIEHLLLPHSVDADEPHEVKVERITNALMSALTPLLGANEDRERLNVLERSWIHSKALADGQWGVVLPGCETAFGATLREAADNAARHSAPKNQP